MMSDGEALRRYAATGDPDSFRVLVEAYGRMVYGACLRLLRREADAQDATQETFIKLALHAGSVRSNIGAWLHAAAATTCKDMVRGESAGGSVRR